MASVLHGSARTTPRLRPSLHEERHRAPVDQALSPLDQRPGRANEPRDQGRHSQGLVALDALGRTMARSKGQFVFPAARGPGNFQGVVKAWRLIARRRLPGATLHTLRHSFASMGEDLGLTLPTVSERRAWRSSLATHPGETRGPRRRPGHDLRRPFSHLHSRRARRLCESDLERARAQYG